MVARMLIDAAHPEETRVVIVQGERVEEFDFESASRHQLKGNIYLAKVARVEPSLQAAFVEYGGNRHGFLPFSEIHPDYYQIPIEDRQAVIDAESSETDSTEIENPATGEHSENPKETVSNSETIGAESDELGAASVGENPQTNEGVEDIGGDEYDEAALARKRRQLKHYKIQEVIKRRQVILVQVVKEERGTKGAALTTYLSLAGRYCVLMPNTWRGGGISRKILAGTDRNRLRSIVESLKIPDGMSLIVRTAGMSRSKAEIKRDFDYLLKQWNLVRETTLESTAPDSVYEEGSLIRRSIRDHYSRDIEQVLVEGEGGYKIAKAFMRQLMPSHAKNVRPYSDRISLFQRYKVEQQLDSMHSPNVELPSGASIVISPTEALVAIDVNSGRATRERNLEETALKTNLEAAQEISRQLRLRDLSGLIVIDFIDMETSRNIRSVERSLKELLKSDRARIQVGRISPFGLLEMSRQRLRPSLLETSTVPCPKCSGIGLIRSKESSALKMLRLVEDELIRGTFSEVHLSLAIEPALYLLNEKRDAVSAIENKYETQVKIKADDSLTQPDYLIEVKTSSDKTVVPQPNPEQRVDSSTKVAGENKKRRRRGKRGGRRTQTAQTKINADPKKSSNNKEDEVVDVGDQVNKTNNSIDSSGLEDSNALEYNPAKVRKPRRRRRPRRRKVASNAADTEAVSVSTTDDSVESPPPPKGSPRRSSSPKKSLEETSSDGEATSTLSNARATAESTKDDQPRNKESGRTGWWRRSSAE